MYQFCSRLRATFWLCRVFVLAALYFRQRALQVLALPAEHAFMAKENRRFKHYYYGVAYLAAVAGSLRGKPLNALEKQLFTLLAALSSRFDDLADSFVLPDDAWANGQNTPELYGLLADPGGLSLHLLRQVNQYLPAKQHQAFRGYLDRVFKVELTGCQPGKDCDTTEVARAALEKVTAEKGGASVLLFRSALSHALSTEEENAFFQCGYLFQLSDDIFDLWHDRQSGANTLATWYAERQDISGLIQCYEQQVCATVHSFRKTPYPARQVATALYVLHYLVSITRACLGHYQTLAQQHTALPLDNRTKIVVDMNFLSHRIQAARYLLRPLEHIF